MKKVHTNTNEILYTFEYKLQVANSFGVSSAYASSLINNANMASVTVTLVFKATPPRLRMVL